MCRFITAMFAITGWLIGAGIACGQDYPNKPVRIITAAAGGGGDFTTRIVAKGVTDNAGWPIAVENRAGGLLAIETVAKAAPDGYVLLVDSLGFLVGPQLQKTSYDPVTDFSAVALATSSPNILVVHPLSGAKSSRKPASKLTDIAHYLSGRIKKRNIFQTIEEELCCCRVMQEYSR